MIDKSRLPLVSVIVPIYNVEQYLEVCVESLRRQTYANLEIILVNDGSPDGCGAMCDRHQQLDDRIVVVHKSNGGLSDARNAGLDICTGEFIAFVDSDDVVHCRYVELLLNHISQSDMVYCGYSSFEDDININPCAEIPTEEVTYHTQADAYGILTDPANTLLVVSWNKLYKRCLWDGLRFKKGVLHEDEFIIHHLVCKVQKITWLGVPLVYYRQRGESITSDKRSKKSFTDKLNAYYDRYLFFMAEGLLIEKNILLQQIYYRCAMKTVERDNVVWRNLNSFKHIIGVEDLSFRLRLILLLKKYMYPLYTAMYSLGKI
ncbi:glycosyltransferase family 2 protein [Sphingobacterium corticibacterium]|uniref:Glycosyltransferase family 2 protein n=1 Tax=Sphingobacterium corticibacterium TaxID=2484746 RepID=A0A4Q6XYN2_9SPHI|nr:glycosyltransferase family 2 protein [Sphingobacterium corticibacterium]RZF61676.1 glycosyltransferase family 2 protein [Sphingobacterium corticibacterium]